MITLITETSQVRRLIEFNEDEIKLYLLTSLKEEETVYIKEAAQRTDICSLCHRGDL